MHNFPKIVSNQCKDIIQHGNKLLQLANIENGEKEIQWFLESQFFWRPGEIIFNKSKMFTNWEKEEFLTFIKRRIAGEPFQYIINNATFYGKDFSVNSSTLIPRPETETIIKVAKNTGPYKNALDIGTGSGNLAIILSLKKIAKHIDAIDISKKALKIAQNNCDRYKLTNIKFEQFNFLKNTIKKTYDLIVSNPPYISYADYCNLEDHIKLYEPSNALTDHKDGITFYKYFAKKLQLILNPKGKIILEIGLQKTKDAIEQLFIKEQFKCIWHKDLNGDNRVLEAYK